MEPCWHPKGPKMDLILKAPKTKKSWIFIDFGGLKGSKLVAKINQKSMKNQ